MLKSIRIIAALCLAGMLAAGCAGGNAVKAPDYSNLNAENHPRVIYADGDFAQIARAADEGDNAYLTHIHETILRTADSCIGAPELTRTLIGKRLLMTSRAALKRILFCAYAYKTTGGPQYLAQAENDIKAVCNFEDWNAERHFLDAGEMAAGVGLAYDWLYADLSDETKALARKALNDFAFRPALTMEHNFYEVDNNWNSVCNGGLVCAALATYEDNPETARKIIERALESNVACMEASYSPDGNYPEGYIYWDYGTMFETMMLTALETAVGSDNGLSSVEGFSKTGKYIIHMEGPSGLSFNYSDCDDLVGPSFPQLYFAWKFGDPSVLFIEKDRDTDMEKERAYGACRILPVFAWHASKIDAGGITAPEEHIFHGEGINPVVLVHGTWTMDEDEVFLGVKAGKAASSHAHMDAGSFVFDAEGLRWASDLGKQEYTDLETVLDIWDMRDGADRWKVFRYNNFSHNTLTVNGACHKVDGEAKILQVVDSDGRRGAVVDISAPLAGEVASAVRTIYIEGSDLVVEDRITAPDDKTAEVRWQIVTPAEPTVEHGDIASGQAATSAEPVSANGSIVLRQGGRARRLSFTSSTGHEPKLGTWDLTGPNSWDDPNDGFHGCGYTLTLNPSETAVVTARLVACQ